MQDFPGELRGRSYLREWHVIDTNVSRLPDFLKLFTQLRVLHLPKNAIEELPPEIGEERTSARRFHTREIMVIISDPFGFHVLLQSFG